MFKNNDKIDEILFRVLFYVEFFSNQIFFFFENIKLYFRTFRSYHIAYTTLHKIVKQNIKFYILLPCQLIAH